jgi:aspartate racemase
LKKTIGVLGGMGPEATAYFFSLIVRRTEARRDQDHIPVIIDCNPRIPERTAALLGRGPSPARQLLAGARRLAGAGADFIVVPCVTAHAFLAHVEARAPVPFVNLVEETVSYARKNMPRLKRVGLLASTGTVRSGLFSQAFAPAGVEVIAPSVAEQKRIMGAIYGRGGIKAGHTEGPPRRQILAVARRLIRRGAEAIIGGCTEIPLVLRPEDLPVPFLEPMRIAAEACIRRAGYRLREEHSRHTPPSRS